MNVLVSMVFVKSILVVDIVYDSFHLVDTSIICCILLVKKRHERFGLVDDET
jgi:hypothetical protein